MKINLFISHRDNTEDKFEFNSMKELFKFIEEYTVEKLIDSNFAEFEYTILVDREC